MKGGCQCGRVRYEVNADPLAVIACHCTECQRQSGSAFGLSLVVLRSSLQLNEAETQSFIRPADSGRTIECVFCKHCGTRIVHKPNYEMAVVNVRAGTLDDPSLLEPVAHTWLRSKQRWVQVPEGALRYEGQPSTEQFLADLAARRVTNPKSVGPSS